MALYGDVFLRQLRGFRMVWLMGRAGGGKTALAVRLAYEAKKRGWCQHIVGNFPCVLFTDLERISEVRDTFIILDEAGIFLKDKQFDDLTAFVRKRNLYIVLSSVQPVPLRAKLLNVDRVLDGYSVGVPIWRYACDLNYGRIKERYTLTWHNPSEVFGLYDTEYEVADDGGIVEWVKSGYSETLERASKTKTQAQVRDGDGDGSVDELRRVAWALNEGAEKITDAVSMARNKVRRR